MLEETKKYKSYSRYDNVTKNSTSLDDLEFLMNNKIREAKLLQKEFKKLKTGKKISGTNIWNYGDTLTYFKMKDRNLLILNT